MIIDRIAEVYRREQFFLVTNTLMQSIHQLCWWLICVAKEPDWPLLVEFLLSITFFHPLGPTTKKWSNKKVHWERTHSVAMHALCLYLPWTVYILCPIQKRCYQLMQFHFHFCKVLCIKYDLTKVNHDFSNSQFSYVSKQVPRSGLW